VRKKSKRVKRGSATPPASGRRPSRPLTMRDVQASAEELIAFHHLFANAFQRREQSEWSFFYLCGQLANLERKTIEPMILGLHGADVKAVRALQRFISRGKWPAGSIMLRGQELVADWLGTPDGVLIVDGSGFPKQGQDSVGVARQYCGHLGKVANCQEGVFLVYASPHGYAFLEERLYLHESWFEPDAEERWKACGIPNDIPFHTEPEWALEMIRGVVNRAVVPFRWVTADEHFGQNPAFLDGIASLRKWYLVEVPCDTRAWRRTPRVEPPGRGLLGRPRTRPRVSRNAPRPHELRDMAADLPASAWTRYIIKEGGKGPLVAEFAFLRVTTLRDELPGPRVWAMFRRNLANPPELKFYLSNAPLTCERRELAQTSGWRWPIETALEEGKGEVGLDHYEIRSWLGWHHHMAQTFMAHLFLTRLQLLFKKKPGFDRGSSPSADRASHRSRLPVLTGRDADPSLSSTEKLCSLPLTSKAHPQAVSSQPLEAEIARNVVVM